jgi:hypothetical protein
VARITQMRYFLYARQLFLRANFSENAVTPTLVKPRTGPAHTAQETPKGGVLSRGITRKMERLRPGRAQGVGPWRRPLSKNNPM